ncbi:DUF3122 domain-containing protein [Tychonema sp. LEGE 07199]|uniref:DUF3122 domain-containing protein n=1 Tax=unclassified Tychonema TaxID=2642144 RepID=UPI001881F4A9|nr:MULTISPECIES: DUF3122 domain-containing protein [unclassified Tychonema]MBE9120234.1 DUF3122 domain-containing protein [Tychonema sp. LEGE 07199]MBE9131846.1 DUF3122 domain-containing protein [Tychonema sp. LEGE 07196]
MNNLSKKPSFFKALTIISLCLYLLTLTLSPPAFASIHKYPEAGDRVMFRSVQSLRDTDDKAWQVVLYKRVKSGVVNSFNLRLVGFPGTELQHPVPLNVAAGSRAMGMANDIWSESDLPINVGEYDFKSIITQVESNQPLRLNLPVKGEKKAALLVPPFAVREWRLLLETN